MEPRRDDGEDLYESTPYRRLSQLPQWSPVVMTGKTRVNSASTDVQIMGRNGAPS